MDTIPHSPTDHYINLIRDTRGLSPERCELREEWFDRLEHPEKRDILFELEMLLKGLAYFGDLDNHAGPLQRGPVETRTYLWELKVVHAVCERIAYICRQLLPAEDDTLDEQELMPAESLEHVSGRIFDEPLDQRLPEQSLRVLLRSFSDLSDVAEVLSRLDPVPYRSFQGMINLACREIERNVYFDPLRFLEFSPEYDHIHQVELLDIIYRDGPEGAQKSISMAFLALHRLLRYLDMALGYLDDPEGAPLFWIAVTTLRGDGRALVRFLRTDAIRWLANGFEEDVLNLRASEIVASAPVLEQDYFMLHDLGSVLMNLGDQLDLDLREAFERKLVPHRNGEGGDALQNRAAGAVRALQDFLKSAVLTLAQLFEPEIEDVQLFQEAIEPGLLLERLRRDIWIFSQILRAFLAKAEAAPETANRWSGTSSYRFVRDFIHYFRTLGFHLLRASGYPRAEEFMALIETVSAAEVLEQDLIDVFAAECAAFREDLQVTFEAISARQEMAGRAFDRSRAAETLRSYLVRR